MGDNKYNSLRIGLIVTAVLLGVVVFAFWLPLRGELPERDSNKWTVESRSSEVDRSDKVISQQTFTANIGTLELVDLLQGDVAKESIVQLHRTNMELKDAYVAKYVGENKQFTIWASVAPSVQEAEGQLQIMHNKMDASSVFTGHQTSLINGKEYHFVKGMGQDHYFYQRGDDVIWIAIQTSQQDTMKVVSDVIRIL